MNPRVPRFVTIYNFIRNSDSRLPDSEEILYQTTRQEILLLKKYALPATFAFQYDALINPRYQKLFREEGADYFEVGGWLELPRQLVEKAGLPWRGRWDWDWRTSVGFTPGYAPDERKKLVDVYMSDFKEIFGRHPRTFGSWYIDEVTLDHMVREYGLVASCNCKDQVGTDGYTLWGGYWNQAYYPSKVNAYMPAQTRDGQIHVPIFRMLGSDPIYQYDAGLGGAHQDVITLEPVSSWAGGSPQWVKWFFDTLIHSPCLAFNFAQAGQENAFGWNVMKTGMELQIPLIAEFSSKGLIQVETLEQNGKWYQENFQVTPPTAFVAATDWKNQNKKTAWFNSRFYRVNFLWENDNIIIRDIHLFRENIESTIFRKSQKEDALLCETLPILDGCRWSKSHSENEKAFMRLCLFSDDGTATPLKAKGDPIFSEEDQKTLRIFQPLENDLTLLVECSESAVEISVKEKISWGIEFRWFVPLFANGFIMQPHGNSEVPIASSLPTSMEVKKDCILYTHNQIRYALILNKGVVDLPQTHLPLILLRPAQSGKIIFDLSSSQWCGVPEVL